MNDRAPLSLCQRRLAMIWFAGSGLIAILLVAQTIRSKYGDQPEKAWSWFLPTILPTLSLIVGAVAYEASRPQEAATVDRFFFKLSISLSVVYLLLVLATLIFQPLTQMTPLRLMDISNLWLGPIQGLVGIALGALFVSHRD
jgi:hypothetical protein